MTGSRRRGSRAAGFTSASSKHAASSRARVADAEPDLPWGHLLCAAALTMSGATAEAAAPLARARERGQGLPNVSLRLGTLHLVRNEWKQAEALFGEALAAMPRAVEAHDGLGCALHAQGRHEEAIAAFRAGLGFTYHSPLTHLHLSLTLAALGRWEEAEQVASVAKAQDENVPGLAALSLRISAARTTT